jgi:hypothetical protein
MKNEKFGDIMLHFSKCARCGKEFIAAPCHVYKHDAKIFCTYSCYNAFLNVIEKPKLEKAKEELAKEEAKQNATDRIFKKQKQIKRTIAKEKKHKRAIAQYTLDGKLVAYHETQKAAADALGVHYSTICMVLNGKRNNAKGYIFKYEEENN